MSDIKRGISVAAYVNPHQADPLMDYSPALDSVLNAQGFDAAQREIEQWPDYAPTPLLELPALAADLNLGAVFYKDESKRFALKSFKALGGAYAVLRLIQSTIRAQDPQASVEVPHILQGMHRDAIQQITVTCATDGNHGRSVAWGAQLFGCQCVIYVHAAVSEGRVKAIESFGAQVIRVDGNYDDSVRYADQQAARNGWTVVSDTTYEGYRDIPIDVMHGYGVMAREVIHQLGGEPPSHVIVQAGVGAFAASVCAAFWQYWGPQRPHFIIVEPEKAACFFISGQRGQPVAVTGELETVMAGLSCGEVSPVAWDILFAGANVFSTVGDAYALQGMRRLANPKPGDPAIVSGETGAAGLALLLAASQTPEVWSALAVDEHSRVLLLGSEGDTDPEIYESIVGLNAMQVMAP